MSLGEIILTYAIFTIHRSRERDLKIVAEIEQVERQAVMPRRWNGPTNREHSNAQRAKRAIRKSTVREGNLMEYENLLEEKQARAVQIDASAARQKESERQLEGLRKSVQMGERRSTGDEETMKALRIEITHEKDARRALRAAQTETIKKITALKDTGLSNVRSNSRQKSDNMHMSGNASEINSTHSLLGMSAN